MRLLPCGAGRAKAVFFGMEVARGFCTMQRISGNRVNGVLAFLQDARNLRFGQFSRARDDHR